MINDTKIMEMPIATKRSGGYGPFKFVLGLIIVILGIVGYTKYSEKIIAVYTGITLNTTTGEVERTAVLDRIEKRVDKAADIMGSVAPFKEESNITFHKDAAERGLDFVYVGKMEGVIFTICHDGKIVIGNKEKKKYFLLDIMAGKGSWEGINPDQASRDFFDALVLISPEFKKQMMELALKEAQESKTKE